MMPVDPPEGLQSCGVLEQGYASASVDRGSTTLRLPWIKKDHDQTPGANAGEDTDEIVGVPL